MKKVSNWTALSNAPYEVQADRAVVLAAVHVNGYALRFASAALRNDKARLFFIAINDSYSLFISIIAISIITIYIITIYCDSHYD